MERNPTKNNKLYIFEDRKSIKDTINWHFILELINSDQAALKTPNNSSQK